MFSRGIAVIDQTRAIHAQTERQVAHWALAAHRLNLDDLASAEAWGYLERYLGMSLRSHLTGVINRLQGQADVLTAMQRAAQSPTAAAEVRRKLLAFRHQYLRTETTLDFFAHAINGRTNPRVAALLRACDTLAYRSMSQPLDQLDKPTPPTLTYPDLGLGASVLKAGLRLWDGDVNPVVAIKITRHNLLRVTPAIHESGHGFAHIAGWNEELAGALSAGLSGRSSELANVWSSWSTEIAADAFAFAHTGFATVAALHDVLAGDMSSVFRFTPGVDPHPVGYIRVLLGVESCRYFYGEGPWDDLGLAWRALHPLNDAPSDTRSLLEDSLSVLTTVVRLTLDTPMRCFKGRPLRALIPPERVSPASLDELERRIGPALFTSAHWLWSEPLRIVALTGLQLARRPAELKDILQLQEQAMLRLGGALQAA
jgi:hypothetical protein